MITGEYDDLCERLERIVHDVRGVIVWDAVAGMYRSGDDVVRDAADAIRTLVADRDMYQRRCLEAVRLNDAANSEIEKLRTMRRGKS